MRLLVERVSLAAVLARLAVTFGLMAERDVPAAQRSARRLFARTRYKHFGRVVLVVVLLLAVFAALRYNDQPGLAVSLYALIPILLGVFWFQLLGGLLTATAAMLAFLVDILITPSGLAGMDLALATLNRSLVFFGVALLVTRLLRRERALVRHVLAQQAELSELESLRTALTPTGVPARPDLQFATSFIPADGVVAGDFFLVGEGPTQSTTIVVGDVVGHGVEAARSAAFVRAALSTFTRFTRDPVELLQLANTALAERGQHVSQFVTAVCLNISAAPELAVRWAAAGHDVPWYLDDGTPLAGGRVGAPLGVGADALKVEAGDAVLTPGSGIFVFTDGLTEARAPRCSTAGRVELFGDERARAIVRDHRGAPPAEILEALVSAVTTFARGPLADDLCLIAIRAQLPAAETSTGHPGSVVRPLPRSAHPSR